MARRILYIAVALVLVGFLYLGYTNYDAGRAISNGEVYSNDPPSAKGTKRGGVVTTDTAEQAIVYPTPSQTGDSTTSTVSPTAQPGQVEQPGVASSTTTAPPGTDTISPNPPNGMVFSGTGKYQLYRQGNITWRLDTDNGHSCILFATDEEWKKPRVYRAGCGKT